MRRVDVCQNRPAANGRSPEITSTTVLGSEPAFSLKTLVDLAQTAVSRLVEDLKADSLDVVELVMRFEDTFGVTIPDEDYEKIRTVGDAIDYIEQREKS